MILLALLVLLFGGYMGSYYMMLVDYRVHRVDRYPLYRYQGECLTKDQLDMVSQHPFTLFYGPAHQIDRLIRPGHWNRPRPSVSK